jgi:outer membrane receptor protein involved in Fe transport
MVRQATFLWRDGTPIDFGALQDASHHSVPNPSGPLGSPLAGAPPFQGNIRARYEFAFNGYEAFAQIGAVHQSHSLSTTFQLSRDLQGHPVLYDLPAFTTFGAALGITKDTWLVQLYGENLTDTRAHLYASYTQYYKAITVNRPRTIGLGFSHKFGGR